MIKYNKNTEIFFGDYSLSLSGKLRFMKNIWCNKLSNISFVPDGVWDRDKPEDWTQEENAQCSSCIGWG